MNKKNKSIKFRLSDEDCQVLQKRANDNFDGNVSAVIRQIIHQALFGEIIPFVKKEDKKSETEYFQFIDLLRKIRTELNKIGINVNHVTKRFNEQIMREDDNILKLEHWQVIAEIFDGFNNSIQNETIYLDRVISVIKDNGSEN